MFGKDKTQDDSSDAVSVPVSVVPTTPVSAAPAPVVPQTPQDELNLPAPTTENSPIHEEYSGASDEESSGAPEVESEEATPMQMPDPMMPTMEQETQEEAPEPIPDEEELSRLSTEPITINSSGTLSDLTSLKQEALHELSPLINHLDQTPDEKYATAKMVYEETNDQALLTSVYEAAKNLSDDKEKAEAIYDVIKKINEFTGSN